MESNALGTRVSAGWTSGTEGPEDVQEGRVQETPVPNVLLWLACGGGALAGGAVQYWTVWGWFPARLVQLVPLGVWGPGRDRPV